MISRFLREHPEQDKLVIDNLDRKSPSVVIATWFYSGLLYPAPGTWGSLAALPLGLLLMWLGGMGALVLAFLLLFPLGLWAAHQFEKKYNTQDRKLIVVDEVLGQWIPLFIAGLNPIMIILAFLSFRFFDIIKIWPASFFDKNFKNAFGVIMDDIFAGFQAAMVLIVIKLFLGF